MQFKFSSRSLSVRLPHGTWMKRWFVSACSYQWPMEVHWVLRCFPPSRKQPNVWEGRAVRQAVSRTGCCMPPVGFRRKKWCWRGFIYLTGFSMGCFLLLFQNVFSCCSTLAVNEEMKAVGFFTGLVVGQLPWQVGVTLPGECEAEASSEPLLWLCPGDESAFWCPVLRLACGLMKPLA